MPHRVHSLARARQRQFDLMLERRQRFRERPSHKLVGISRIQSRRPEVAGVKRGNKIPDDIADRFTGRQARRCATVAAPLRGGAQLAELGYDISVLGIRARLLCARSSRLARMRVEDRLIHGLLIEVELRAMQEIILRWERGPPPFGLRRRSSRSNCMRRANRQARRSRRS